MYHTSLGVNRFFFGTNSLTKHHTLALPQKVSHVNQSFFVYQSDGYFYRS